MSRGVYRGCGTRLLYTLHMLMPSCTMYHLKKGRGVGKSSGGLKLLWGYRGNPRYTVHGPKNSPNPSGLCVKCAPTPLVHTPVHSPLCTTTLPLHLCVLQLQSPTHAYIKPQCNTSKRPSYETNRRGSHSNIPNTINNTPTTRNNISTTLSSETNRRSTPSPLLGGVGAPVRFVLGGHHAYSI